MAGLYGGVMIALDGEPPYSGLFVSGIALSNIGLAFGPGVELNHAGTSMTIQPWYHEAIDGRVISGF